MKDKIDIKDQKTVAKLLHAALETEPGQKAVLACMDKLFADGRWEIPDEAVVGLVKNKVDQLDAQVKSLTGLLSQLSAQINGGKTKAGRVDVMEETATNKPGKSGK